MTETAPGAAVGAAVGAAPGAADAAQARTLVLIRHARAAAAPTDIERPLSDAGAAQARALAAALATRVGSADLLIVSPARRARQTSQPIAERLSPGRTLVEEDVYFGGGRAVLELVRQARPGARTVIVVGHEPTTSELAAYLDGGVSDLGRRVSYGMSTANAAVLRVGSPWAALTGGSAEVIDLLTPAH
ncbi:SixA phosphatase family protein [Actinomyces sp. zg328]|uniref:SixA phosphatase family protein n=1 Tax=Actinomyces sp. zg328 TaxID=2609287 RepID=UPI001358931F|nr:histidine phosphatase family protein [Actinomyces sp. zg328]